MKVKISGFLAIMAILFGGCSSVVYHGGKPSIDPATARILLPPFNNATDDEHAARAMTEMAATALLERGVPVVQTEALLVKTRAENAAGNDGLYLEAARAAKATHLLIGTIHEYRYKTDLDGDPVVGITMRIVDAQDGTTLWQGTSTKVDLFAASLSSAAQRAARNLVREIPLGGQSLKGSSTSR